MNPAKTGYTRTLLKPDRNQYQRRAVTPLTETLPNLHSTFAIEQLTAVARRCIAPQFVMLLAPIFGYDLPPHTYIKLQQALLEGTFENPLHRIDQSAAYPADYDNSTRTLNIHPQAFAELLQAPERAWELLAILLHEFGHHVDNLLRQELADNQPPADAQRDEGSRYARAMARCEPTHEGSISIARYTRIEGDDADIFVDYPEAMQAVARFQSDSAAGTVEGERERFEAGNSDDHKEGHFSHETIAQDLAELGFREDEIKAIYFGNWLRDYSQLLDPKIVRATDMPKNFPDILSRQALTKIVDVLAARKFSELRAFIPEHFTVTEEKLGLYLPSEHIDNPRVDKPGIDDPKTRDPAFEAWILPDDPLLQVDYQSSMKRYIHRSGERMQNDLRIAMQSGRNADGLRYLGSALHVLEDFFAHSNFVELSLIKLDHKVLPWTSKADCQWGLPLVTGTFSGPDVIASLAYPVAKLIAPVNAWQFRPSVAGERSDTEKMLLILLSEHQTEGLLSAYESYLSARDIWSRLPLSAVVGQYFWSKTLLLRLIKNAYGTIFQGVLKLVGNSIGDAQTLLGDDPNSSGSTDPSHSQLAKDHAEHPLHELAANLATAAVMDVTQAMVDHWNRKPGADPAAVASAYFAHPQDSHWQDETVARWAGQNPEAIRLGASKSELDKINQHLHDISVGAFRAFADDGLSAWEYIMKNISGLIDLKGNANKSDKDFDIKDSGNFVIKNS